ncbi:MAG: endonuclease/exonuclease/phosphatase family protein [Dehalococcoidia bacterium]
MLKIATWNMNHWRTASEARPRTWAYLEEQIQPDVALVQEAAPLESHGRVVWRVGGIAGKGWGSAIVSYGPELTPMQKVRSLYADQEMDLLRTHPGSVAIGQVRTDEGTLVSLFSVYGKWDGGYSNTTVHRILSDIVPLLENEKHCRYAVLAGDLNVGTNWQGSEYYVRQDQNLLDRIAALGLFDCIDQMLPQERGRLAGCPCALGNQCRHVRTQKHAQYPESPIQTDYIFATEALAARLKSADALNQDETIWEFSDHCPLVAEFDA